MPPVSAGPSLLFVIVLIIGVGFTIWKVSTARRMARDSGMSTSDATAMALLTDDGFESTYLASNLRGQTAGPAPVAPSRDPASERLAELQTLRERGLVAGQRKPEPLVPTVQHRDGHAALLRVTSPQTTDLVPPTRSPIC